MIFIERGHDVLRIFLDLMILSALSSARLEMIVFLLTGDKEIHVLVYHPVLRTMTMRSKHLSEKCLKTSMRHCTCHWYFDSQDIAGYNVYRNPLHASPLSARAASIDSYFPFLTAFMVSSSEQSLPIISSRSPRSRRLFSSFNWTRKTAEHIHPMAMYARTIPWPSLNHGASCARYTLDDIAPLMFPQPIAIASVTPRL